MGTPVISTGNSDRLLHLDAWRGLAIAGILLVNIYAFGLPYDTLNNPGLLPSARTSDVYNWMITSVFLDGSFRALLSFLFGAGLMLWQEKLPPQQAGHLYFRRMIILLILGLVHAYLLLWFWDILFMYAVCGMLLYAIRKWPVSRLLYMAIFCVFIADLNANRKLFEDKLAIKQAKLLGDAGQYHNRFKEWDTGFLKTRIQKEIKDKISSFTSLYRQQAARAWQVQTNEFPGFYMWDILIWVLLGIIFYKMKWLSSSVPPAVYTGLLLAGVAGLLLCWWRIQPAPQNNFDPIATIKDTHWQYYELARTLRSLGWLGLLIWLWQTARAKWLLFILAPMGRLSLSHYMVQSLICAVLFYYPGFVLFGQLGRMQLLLIALLIILLQMIISHWWVKKYRIGLAERLLRA